MTLGWQCRIEKSGGILCVRSRLRSKDDDDDDVDAGESVHITGVESKGHIYIGIPNRKGV